MARLSSFDGIDLHYLDQGRGPAVLCLHGFLCSAEIDFVRRGLLDRFAAQGRRVLALDARGHGASDAPTDPQAYGARAMARDVEALLDHLALPSIDLLGYSLGAFTALEVALRDPRVGALFLTGIGGATLDVARLRQEADGLAAAEPVAGSWFRDAADQLGSNRAACAAWLRGARLPQITADAFPSVACPVLVVNGAGDPLDSERFAARFPRGRGVTVPGDHGTALDGAAWAEVALGWLAGGGDA